jgi:predicted DCC family thiol-disulfide oxidoreductase YuxK
LADHAPPRRPTAAATKPIMLYDGDCGFCTHWIHRISGWSRPRVPIVAYQSVDLAPLGVTAWRADREVLYVNAGGQVYGGAQAFARMLLTGRATWRAVGVLLAVPPTRWLAAGVYRVVANNRMRLPAGTAACAVPRQPDPTPFEHGA